MNDQARVNNAASELRKAVITQLIFNDIMSCNARMPETEELAWRAKEVYKLPVPTRMLEKLFSKTRDIIEHYNVPVCLNALRAAMKLYLSHEMSNVYQPWGVGKDMVGYNTDADLELRKAIAEEKCFPTEYNKAVSDVEHQLTSEDSDGNATADNTAG